MKCVLHDTTNLNIQVKILQTKYNLYYNPALLMGKLKRGNLNLKRKSINNQFLTLRMRLFQRDK